MSSATGPYPTTKQFNEACLNPASAFATGYLKTAKFRQFGPPLLRNFVLQGRFAAVSRAELADGRTLGIRFLKSSQPGLLKRYQTLSRVFIRRSRVSKLKKTTSNFIIQNNTREMAKLFKKS